MGRWNCCCWTLGRSCWRGAVAEFGCVDGASSWGGGGRRTAVVGDGGGEGDGGGGGGVAERRNLGNPWEETQV